ncbi:unnamed protein product [Phytophthora lilii]|uniref:Unnamed protein product n=1 Tax=Phytophthora lilii TaxID=2077276 RepID=A0A9W7CLT8_9STRA|nr:unnamed protein product [Phytophthora lilii]
MARIRSSARTKQEATQIRAVDFRHLWHQLKANGWTSKKPTRLSTDWKYFAPCAAQNELVEGTNFFVGMQLANCNSLLETDDIVITPAAHEDVEDLSQNAVQNAFELSQPLLEESDHDVVAGAFQRLLSEAESEGNDLVMSEEGKCEEDDPAHAGRGMAQSIEDDVNMLRDGDDAKVNENIDSGTSDGGGDSEDDAVEPREYPENLDLSDGEVALVDEASLSGSLDIDNIDKDALKRYSGVPHHPRLRLGGRVIPTS